ncbi:MAG: divalent-cation tolerance protein CutA [Elusimicrobia bacterium]|nr:divalent-cation tolerance protein CutA [Elusimicrobiota bacterium]
MKYVVVFVTASSQEEANTIGHALVKDKLAACVNLVPGIHSTYWWQGKIESSQETLLIVKTFNRLVPRLITRVKALHSYTVPEVIACPIVGGNRAYLQWIEESLKGEN